MKRKIKGLAGSMKPKTTIWNIERYELGGKYRMPRNLKKATLITQIIGKEQHIQFITDCKHLQEDLQDIKKP